ncbi:phosphoglycolate phosphatase [Methylohalomonas lacus]|uniref:Phosphoglycolate phosphatase n=1 Tax=Methylohalomonas lacus TaxID=398773 RepID=A0AAE3HK68_9GAMM|nr:HAD-IA family hydrolase [Methylohalomonas lacus]MCS3902626.1 phosphoglycolate phosphatase [Methylohalomonas lacus]
MKLTYRLLIFDWDGTLADSEAIIIRAMQAAIAEQSLPARGADAVRDIIGLGLAEAVQRLYPQAPAATLRELAGTYQQAYLAATTRPVPLFPGAAGTLVALRQAGYQLAVATGKSRRGLERALIDSDLTAQFDATRCADETLSKPDPLMLHEVLAELSVPASAALMIGDSEHDIEMAGRAGVPALGVTSGVHPADRLLQSGAIDCIDSVAGLGDWLLAGQMDSAVSLMVE